MAEEGSGDRTWLASLPMLDHFVQVLDPTRYDPLPDDWLVGLSDVVDSTSAIEAGRYKAVNLAGAGTISAVANALRGNLPLFAFGGDGARFAVPKDEAAAAAEALSQVGMWAKRDLDLDLRIGMKPVAEIRKAGHDVRVAFWRASEHVRYALFTGGGLEWVEASLKKGDIGLQPAEPDDDPDLSGLSCQWGPVQPKQGKILSLIVKPVPGASQADFAAIASRVVALLEETGSLNPVPAQGPDVRWPGPAIDLQSRVARRGTPSRLRRRTQVLMTAAFSWLVFALGIRIGRFDPTLYRREIAVNTDFRKFDDGLMMTVDCNAEIADKLREILEAGVAEGVVRYGLHLQDEALMTCVVSSVLAADHMHFVDGAGGGYASAARQLDSTFRE